MAALSVGLPCRLKSRITPFVYVQRSIAALTNSVPLSQSMRFGNPRSKRSRSSVPTTSRPLRPWPTFAGEQVDDGQCSESSTIHELVGDEVRAPDVVARRRRPSPLSMHRRRVSPNRTRVLPVLRTACGGALMVWNSAGGYATLNLHKTRDESPLHLRRHTLSRFADGFLPLSFLESVQRPKIPLLCPHE